MKALGRTFVLVILGLVLTARVAAEVDRVDAGADALAVSTDGRYLVKVHDGSAFFWLADAAWYLPDLAPADVDDYLRDRASRGFNVIQGPIIIRKPFDGPELTPDYAGEPSLWDGADGIVLNERYLRHIDSIVDQARKYGLYITLTVIWGSILDQILSVDDPGQARDIGRQLGRRYKDKPNVIWIVCGEYHKIAWESAAGDRSLPNAREIALIEALAAGLEDGHGGANLMTIHPDAGRSSSEHFHGAAWLDFHMIQTYEVTEANANLITADHVLTDPVRPTLNAEPGYEGRNRGSTSDPMTAYKVRYEAYQSVFQGAMGHSYGHWDIWRFADHWKPALDSEGARAMGDLRALMESRPMAGAGPDPTLIRNDAGSYAGLRKLRAIRGADGGSAFVYFPDADLQADIDPGGLTGGTVHAWWFNPRDGLSYSQAGNPSGQPFITFERGHPPQRFQPPGSRGQEDWVLVLDDASRKFSPPGSGMGVRATIR